MYFKIHRIAFLLLAFWIADCDSQTWYHQMKVLESPSFNDPASWPMHVLNDQLLVISNETSGEIQLHPLSQTEKTISQMQSPLAKTQSIKFHGYRIRSATMYAADSILYFSAELRNGNMRLYETQFHDGRWSKPKPLHFSSEQTDDQHPYYDYNTGKLYFASRRSGGWGGWDIWYTQQLHSEWLTPTCLGQNVNSPMNDWHPSICNGDLLYSSDQDLLNGGFEMRLSPATSGYTTSLSLPGFINSVQNDLRIIEISSNELLLIRTSLIASSSPEWYRLQHGNTHLKKNPQYRLLRAGHGVSDLRLKITFENTENHIITSDKNGFLELPQQAVEKHFTLQMEEALEPCELQITDDSGHLLATYTIAFGVKITLEPLNIIMAHHEGWHVQDESTLTYNDEVLNAPRDFEYRRNKEGEIIALVNKSTPQSNSNYSYSLPNKTTASCAKEIPTIPLHLPILPCEKNLISNTSTNTEIELDGWRIDRIYFENASDNLVGLATEQCKIISEVMIMNPNLRIELIGHADANGSEMLNQTLGFNRTLTIKSELGKYGISSERILNTSVGETSECLINPHNQHPSISAIMRRVDIRYRYITALYSLPIGEMQRD